MVSPWLIRWYRFEVSYVVFILVPALRNKFIYKMASYLKKYQN